MPHTLAVIGRPNVGKSTLFNRMLRQNKALIYDQPGVTRDRLYGTVRRKGMEYELVDTGGLVLEDPEGFEEDILLQAQEAMADSQAILFVVDGQEGLTAADEAAADMLRRSDKPVILAVNKVDGPEHEGLSADFHSLGFEQITMSAAHGWHMPLLEERIEALLESLGPPPERVESIERGLTLAVLGRPNAGKSSIVNAVTGERRLIVSDVPGTTRDSVDVTVDIGGKRYTFIDTAGVRRKQRIGMELERFSVMRALKNSKTAKVTVLVLTANEGLTMQDKKLLSLLDREKTPFIVAVNRMDLVPKKEVREAKQ
jgi:GTP-binding protein